MISQSIPKRRREFAAFSAFEAFALSPDRAEIRAKDYLIAFEGFDEAGEKLAPDFFACSFSEALKRPFTYLAPAATGECLLTSSPVTVDTAVTRLEIEVVAWSQNADARVASAIRENLWVQFREVKGATWSRKM